ncbi:hypothetical protein [Pelagicoccus albus]|uniref:Uncharacterized protein n=1 Tax=Pelagicoccus albus TaxID=415222 RepID=A0A7X1B474_9BACT|nr:hypothetical protein [Pelagicoccus albus]MBC2605109.1 hypothetical protein [Pelagicoccus albus]
MKSLASILCLFATVLNVAVAYSGGMLFCEHDEGSSHLVSAAVHASNHHVDDCHQVAELADCVGHELGDCDSCTDTNFAQDGARELLRNADQARLAPPLFVYLEAFWIVDDHAFELVTENGFSSRSHRVPPARYNCLLARETVLRI